MLLPDLDLIKQAEQVARNRLGRFAGAMVQTARTEDYREGAKAFVEKRPGLHRLLKTAPRLVLGSD